MVDSSLMCSICEMIEMCCDEYMHAISRSMMLILNYFILVYVFLD